MKKNIVLITTMVRTHDQAQKILQDLLDKHLASAVQIQEIVNHALEDGKVKKEREVQVMIKTQTDVIKKTLEELLKLHPYDVPEILVHDVTTHHEYEDWVKQQIKKNSCCPD